MVQSNHLRYLKNGKKQYVDPVLLFRIFSLYKQKFVNNSKFENSNWNFDLENMEEL